MVKPTVPFETSHPVYKSCTRSARGVPEETLYGSLVVHLLPLKKEETLTSLLTFPHVRNEKGLIRREKTYSFSYLFRLIGLYCAQGSHKATTKQGKPASFLFFGRKRN